MAKIKRADFQPTDDGQGVISLLRQFLVLKKQGTALAKREKEVKDRLSGMVEEYGDEDDRGHIFYELPEPVEGVLSLKRERRERRVLDQEHAEVLLKEKGLYETCTKTIVILDEDAIMQAYYGESLTEDDIDSMFNTTVTYAFVPQRK